jgi:tetratricopeptide (TPR) repeat protein
MKTRKTLQTNSYISAASIPVLAAVVAWFGTLVFTPTIALGQKKAVAVSERDTAAINDAAKNALKQFFLTLYFITDPSYSSEDKKVFIDKTFTTEDKIFTDRKKAQIEDDHNPAVLGGNGDEMALSAEDYLNTLSVGCKSTDNNNVYNISNISCVQKVAGRLAVKIRYTQQFFFQYEGDEKSSYPKVIREAVFFVQRDSRHAWRAYINNVYFFDTSKTPTADCVPVTDVLGEVATDSLTPERLAHFRYLQEKGTRAILAKSYVEAYYCLKSASMAPALTTPCKNLISDRLYVTMLKNGIENQDAFLADGLQKKAQDLEEAYRYRDALTYYGFAYALSPTNLGLYNRINALEDKNEGFEKATGYFNNGLYARAKDEAIRMLQDAENKKNPYLFDLLARSYVHLNNYKSAEVAYDAALKLDPGTASIYINQSECYRQSPNPDYGKAYEALVNAMNLTDPADPAAAGIKSDMVLCKGLAAFRRGDFTGAADSFELAANTFESAVSLNPKNVDAFIMAGKCLMELGRPADAVRNYERAIGVDPKCGRAYYLLSVAYRNLYLKSNNPADATLALTHLKTAAALDRANGTWNMELGVALMHHHAGDSTSADFLADAVNAFSNCILFDSVTMNSAFMFRGECYFSLGQPERAREDFEKVDTNCLPDKTFFNDLGFMYLKANKPDSALLYFNRNADKNGRAMYGKGEAIFLNNLYNATSEPYLVWFEKAFRAGLSHDLVAHDAVMALISKKDKSVRKMKKSYGY